MLGKQCIIDKFLSFQPLHSLHNGQTLKILSYQSLRGLETFHGREKFKIQENKCEQSFNLNKDFQKCEISFVFCIFQTRVSHLFLLAQLFLSLELMVKIGRKSNENIYDPFHSIAFLFSRDRN